MEKGSAPNESAPPYPGPPMNYGGPMPQPMMYSQPGMYPQAPPPPPPAAGYQAVGNYPPAQTPITTVTHVVMAPPPLHDTPGQTRCPHCQQTVVTQTQHHPGLLTWAICGVLAFFGCFLCCCIPFCVDSCQDVEHRCPSCHNVIHIYKRM